MSHGFETTNAVSGGTLMSDFAYAYFSTEMEKLELPQLEEIFEKAKRLILKKKKEITIDSEVEEKISLLNSIVGIVPSNINLESEKEERLSRQ